jgi:hypothetical protein
MMIEGDKMKMLGNVQTTSLGIRNVWTFKKSQLHSQPIRLLLDT